MLIGNWDDDGRSGLSEDEVTWSGEGMSDVRVFDVRK